MQKDVDAHDNENAVRPGAVSPEIGVSCHEDPFHRAALTGPPHATHWPGTRIDMHQFIVTQSIPDADALVPGKLVSDQLFPFQSSATPLRSPIEEEDAGGAPVPVAMQ